MKSYYDDGRGIQIYHGDCREIIPDLPMVELILTDPPYGISWSRGVHAAKNSKAHDGIIGDHDTTSRDAALRLLADTPAIVFGSFYAKYPENLKQVLVWHKPTDAGVIGSTTGFRRDAEPIFIVGPWPKQNVRWSSVLRSTGSICSVTTETGHPHTKPLSLISGLLQYASARSVLDPFMGSGTTLLAAKNLGIRAIGVEIEEKYCEIAAKRLSQEVLDFSEDKSDEWIACIGAQYQIKEEILES